jgi:hypothetical protein
MTTLSTERTLRIRRYGFAGRVPAALSAPGDGTFGATPDRTSGNSLLLNSDGALT